MLHCNHVVRALQLVIAVLCCLGSINATFSPTSVPSSAPSQMPILVVTAHPTSLQPSYGPSHTPSTAPSHSPTVSPASALSSSPSSVPSSVPSPIPSSLPTIHASLTNTPSSVPSSVPSSTPSSLPTIQVSLTNTPSLSPFSVLSSVPSSTPSSLPTIQVSLTNTPSLSPSSAPSSVPSSTPSLLPTIEVSLTNTPSLSPSSVPSSVPSSAPSTASFYPSTMPTSLPTSPTLAPTSQPTTAMPTSHPSTSLPSPCPSSAPTLLPTSASRTFMIFYTAQDLEDVNSVEFASDHMSSVAFRSTVAEFISYVSPESVYITEAEERLLSITPHSNEATTIHYETRVPVSTWSYSSADVAYSSATSQLSESVNSGNFTSALRRYASVFGATSLLEATASMSGLRISLDYDIASPASPTPSPVQRTASPTELNVLSGSDLSADKWYSPVFVPVLLTGAILVVFVLFVGGSRAWKRWNVYGEGSARYTRHIHHEPVMFSLGDEEDMLENAGGMFSRRRSSLESANSDISTKSPQLDEDVLVM